jgi:hypothetical protein
MADAEDGLEFLEGGVGMFFDVNLEFLRIELAPVSPAFFGGKRSPPGGGQITGDGAATNVKATGGFDFGIALVDEFDHPFTQIKAIGFHAFDLIRLCANVNMKCYSFSFAAGRWRPYFVRQHKLRLSSCRNG